MIQVRWGKSRTSRRNVRFVPWDLEGKQDLMGRRQGKQTSKAGEWLLNIPRREVMVIVVSLYSSKIKLFHTHSFLYRQWPRERDKAGILSTGDEGDGSSPSSPSFSIGEEGPSIHRWKNTSKHLLNNRSPPSFSACKDQQVIIVHLKLNWAGHLFFSPAVWFQKLPAGIILNHRTKSPTL